ncbi:MAG: carboxylating nicotinate-nucleotide diphosphorylase [Candidatus Lokiarchaeota archaeon]|nr:carboxylating nicotinate-nucleotide diphosphorylase [Candidatus Lokiarchaeota archaeon]
MNLNKIRVEEILKKFLEEDCYFNDISSEVIPENSLNTAKIISKSSGYISGLEEATVLFKLLNIKIILHKKDGEKIKSGDIILRLEGNTRNILLGERLALNLLTHMSAITTTTKKFLDIIHNSGKKIILSCTRKTLPGLRIFQKKAVHIGGGDTHRFSLDDMVLLKDTHLKYYDGNIEKILKVTRQKVSYSKKIEIEIEKVEDIIIAAKNGADIIMCDNMTPENVKKSIELLEQSNLRKNKNILVEVSGGITLDNIHEYLDSSPDIISVGDITSFPSTKIDLSLRFD